MFFVISGYLITTIILQQIQDHTFSLRDFYIRRARRILPALFLVLTVSSILSCGLLYPTDLEGFTRSLTAVILFVSNIHFWRNSDYFALDAEITPLLHTWSLAIEEQFYLFFPLLLMFIWQFGVKKIFWILMSLVVVSLLLSLWVGRVDSLANFYLTPSRIWELLAGAVSALVLLHFEVRKSDLLSAIGLISIFFSIVSFDETTQHPSLYTVLPVSGAALLILFAQHGTYAAALLGTRFFLGLGLISYSAYLWHQPVFAFSKVVYGQLLPLWATFGLIALVLTLSYLSWAFVEQPCRSAKRVPPRIFWGVSLITLVGLASFAALSTLSNGMTGRFAATGNGYWERSWTNEYNLSLDCGYDEFSSQVCRYSGPDEEYDFLVVGDSHAGHLYPGLAKYAADHAVSYMVYAAGSCHPVLGFEQRNGCGTFSTLALELINSKKIKNLILAGYHQNVVAAPSRYLRGYSAFLEAVDQENFNIYLLRDSPAFDLSFKDCGAPGLPMRDWLSPPDDLCPKQVGMDLVKAQNPSYNNEFITPLITAHPEIKVLDANSAFCGEEGCKTASDDGYLFFGDDNHLSKWGSEFLWSYWFAERMVSAPPEQ